MVSARVRDCVCSVRECGGCRAGQYCFTLRAESIKTAQTPRPSSAGGGGGGAQQAGAASGEADPFLSLFPAIPFLSFPRADPALRRY